MARTQIPALIEYRATNAQINLINVSPDPDKVASDLAIVNCARTSFMGESKGYDADKRLLLYLYRHEHSSPFEQVDYLFWASMPYSEWFDLTADPRYRVFAYMTDPDAGQGYFRIDINNAVKFVHYHPESRVSDALRLVIRTYNAWTAEAMGLEPVGEVVYRDPIIPESCPVEGMKGVTVELHDIPPVSLLDAICADGFDERALVLFSARFRIHAPVVFWWQAVRHRMSFNLQSGRYMELTDDPYVPAVWRAQSKSNKQGSAGALGDEMQQYIGRLYANTVETARRAYFAVLGAGVSREMARFFLPGFTSFYTGVMKGDLLALRNFFRLRTAPDAQEEIRRIAVVMQSLLEPHLD